MPEKYNQIRLSNLFFVTRDTFWSYFLYSHYKKIKLHKIFKLPNKSSSISMIKNTLTQRLCHFKITIQTGGHYFPRAISYKECFLVYGQGIWPEEASEWKFALITTIKLCSFHAGWEVLARTIILGPEHQSV